MAEETIVPRHEYALVRLDAPEKVSPGGIPIPGATGTRSGRGTVVSSPTLVPGARVILREYCNSTEIEKDLVLVLDKDIIGEVFGG